MESKSAHLPFAGGDGAQLSGRQENVVGAMFDPDGLVAARRFVMLERESARERRRRGPRPPPARLGLTGTTLNSTFSLSCSFFFPITSDKWKKS